MAYFELVEKGPEAKEELKETPAFRIGQIVRFEYPDGSEFFSFIFRVQFEKDQYWIRAPTGEAIELRENDLRLKQQDNVYRTVQLFLLQVNLFGEEQEVFKGYFSCRKLALYLDWNNQCVFDVVYDTRRPEDFVDDIPI